MTLGSILYALTGYRLDPDSGAKARWREAVHFNRNQTTRAIASVTISEKTANRVRAQIEAKQAEVEDSLRDTLAEYQRQMKDGF